MICTTWPLPMCEVEGFKYSLPFMYVRTPASNCSVPHPRAGAACTTPPPAVPSRVVAPVLGDVACRCTVRGVQPGLVAIDARAAASVATRDAATRIALTGRNCNVDHCGKILGGEIHLVGFENQGCVGELSSQI
jgi:hypothetical protein